VRTLVIRKNTDLAGLSSELLASGLNAGASRSALDALQALNPHVDLNKLATGAVLVVPDEPQYKAAASKSIGGGTLDDFEKLVESALDATASRLKQGEERRNAERAELATALKSAAVKRAAESDPQLAKAVEDAAQRVKKDEKDAEKTMQALSKSVHGELAALAKLLA
jgi:hypothetical protein